MEEFLQSFRKENTEKTKTHQNDFSSASTDKSDNALADIRSIWNSDVWKNNNMAMPLAVGKDTSGNPVVFDLAKAQHLLGTAAGGVEGEGTGVGKAVQHSLTLCQPCDGKAVILLVQEEPGFLAVYEVHRILYTVFDKSAVESGDGLRGEAAICADGEEHKGDAVFCKAAETGSTTNSALLPCQG